MFNWLTQETGSRPLGLARVGVGAASLIKLAITAPVLIGLTQPETLLTPFLSWFPAPTLVLVTAIIILWCASAAAFVLGWRVQLTGALLAAVMVTTVALDQQVYSNHLYLLTWLVFLLTLADAGAGLNYRRIDRSVVRWPMFLLMAQLSIVYGFSAFSKIHADFLSGQVLAGALRDGLLTIPDQLIVPRFMSVLAAVVIVTEASLAVLIWSSQFRPAVFVLGMALHLSILLTMSASGHLLVFSIAMLSLYPLFLGGERLRVTWSPDCSDCRKIIQRCSRLDLLRVLDLDEAPTHEEISLFHRGRTTGGADAHARILEHVVPWLWIAPVLRIPGVRHLHQLRHRRRHHQIVAARQG